MKKIFIIAGVFLFCFNINVVPAKSVNHYLFDNHNENYNAQFRKAMNYMLDDDFKDALPILNALLKIDPTNKNVEFHIGICKFYLMFDKSSALEHFNRASQNISSNYINVPTQKGAPIDVIYFQAQSNHLLGNFDKAKELYQAYIDKSKKYKADREFVKSAKRKIEFCTTPDKIFSQIDNSAIKENRKTKGATKQDFAYKNRLSKALQVMESDHIEALILLREMAKDYPNDPNVNYFLGICMLNFTPLRPNALDYFQTADKFIVSPASQTGLACPSLNQYYIAVANQMIGNHEEAVKHFENFKKVYPNEFLAFKTNFEEKLEYSKNYGKVQTNEVAIKHDTVSNIAITPITEFAEVISTLNQDSKHEQNANLKIVRNTINVKAKKDLSVIFPEPKPRVREIIDRIEYSSGYYYTIQIGEGNLCESYFEKVKDYRIHRGEKSKYPRYFVGRYTKLKEAQKKLKELIEHGYTDAFITRFKTR